ncbi:Rpn family recombination-promoting nuclease/putative transposase [Trichothermofontia sp.]
MGKSIALTRLSPSELSLQPIRADALILLQSDEVVLHIEFQTDPDDDIPFRMTDYCLRGFRRFPKKPMHQVVIYLRRSTSEKVYQNVFELPHTRHEFQVIRLWEQPTDVFLRSPGLLPFAVLTQTPDPAVVLQTVVQQVEAMSDRQQRSDVAASTAVLAGLVLNQEIIQQLLGQEIMRESVMYQAILAEGKAEGKREVALNLLKLGMSVEQVAAVTELPIAEIAQLQI